MNHQLVRAVALACALVFAWASVSASAIAGGAATQASSRPCGTLGKSHVHVHYTHVIWIVEENHSYGSIIGNTTQAPYINGLASACGLATNYHNISHPSLPNYIALTSGLPLGSLSPFVSDCDPSSACSTSTPSIFGQTPSWKAYEESMPSNCDLTNSGEYAVRHNPAPYYTSLTNCAAHDIPYTALTGNLASGKLPAFSFITPNLIDDMHDGTIAQGDQWLRTNLPTILNSSEYKAGTVAVFITWDEGEGGTSTDCATNTTDVGCQVATLVISPSTKPGTRSTTLFNHYSLLRTAEQLLGLPLLGQASGAGSMLKAFGL